MAAPERVCDFTGTSVQLLVDLPADYATRYPGDHWWRLRFHFGSTMNDQTAIGVELRGNPVHLVR